MTVPNVFAVAAFIILAGFAGRILFQRTRIPDIPILLGIGVLMGPVLHVVGADLLLPLAPYVGTLALLMIMLEGGMNLDVDRVLSQMKWAVALTLLAFVSTTVAIAGMYHAATGTSFAESLLLGALLGCTSGAIVIPLVQGMRMGKNTRTILTIEAAVGDALAVFTVFLIIRYIQIPSADPGKQILFVADAFLWSGILGALAGLLWVRILARTGKLPLSYMLTMAWMLLLYALVEALHASGVFAVLVFGMTLSNGDVIMQWIPSPSRETSWETSRFVLDETIGWIHEEMVFIARVFFFVYLGMLLDFRQISPFFIGVSAALIAIVYAARQYLRPRHRLPREKRGAVRAQDPDDDGAERARLGGPGHGPGGERDRRDGDLHPLHLRSDRHDERVPYRIDDPERAKARQDPCRNEPGGRRIRKGRTVGESRSPPGASGRLVAGPALSLPHRKPLSGSAGTPW